MSPQQREAIVQATTRHGALWMNTYTDTVLVERDEGTVLQPLYPDGELADYRHLVTNGDANGRAAGWFVDFLAEDVEAGLLDDLADPHPFGEHKGHNVRARWNELVDCDAAVSGSQIHVYSETMKADDSRDGGGGWFFCADCDETVYVDQEAHEVIYL